MGHLGKMFSNFGPQDILCFYKPSCVLTIIIAFFLPPSFSDIMRYWLFNPSLLNMFQCCIDTCTVVISRTIDKKEGKLKVLFLALLQASWGNSELLILFQSSAFETRGRIPYRRQSLYTGVRRSFALLGQLPSSSRADVGSFLSPRHREFSWDVILAVQLDTKRKLPYKFIYPRTSDLLFGLTLWDSFIV